jgi:hypothetical protein
MKCKDLITALSHFIPRTSDAAAAFAYAIEVMTAQPDGPERRRRVVDRARHTGTQRLCSSARKRRGSCVREEAYRCRSFRGGCQSGARVGCDSAIVERPGAHGKYNFEIVRHMGLND